MSTDSFHDRMTELIDRIGDGELIGTVVVDQIYAKIQHEDLTFDHENGGQAKYLTQPLFEKRDIYFGDVAATILDDGGVAGMIESTEDLATLGGVMKYAPVEWGDLRRSGHPSVLSGLDLVYDRPPLARRLTEAELKAKSRLSRPPGPLLGYIWWHVEHHVHPPDYGR